MAQQHQSSRQDESATFRSIINELRHEWGFVIVRTATPDSDDQWSTALEKLRSHAISNQDPKADLDQIPLYDGSPGGTALRNSSIRKLASTVLGTCYSYGAPYTRPSRQVPHGTRHPSHSELLGTQLILSPTIVAWDVNYCNITVTYTHPGQNDIINVETWLPMDSWDGRLQSVGGEGWVAGPDLPTYFAIGAAVGEVYATMSSDAGIGTIGDISSWALLSPGNVDLHLLQDLASVSLNDATIITKDLISSLYGQPPEYSYWSGCSQGGRQGLMLAQRYPDANDGIVASAPAINVAELFTASMYPALFIKWLGEAPRPCELDTITRAAVEACDVIDGVTDGVIADAEKYIFDPFTLIDTTFNCTDTRADMKISQTAALVANATWEGARSSKGVPL
ncbi:hypothetical protein AAE478_005322 [Parahypoxylon ruwenzoriense]